MIGRVFRQTMQISEDFALQKEPDKWKIYSDRPGIWWSDKLRRWIVVDPELIREIMNDPAFVVSSFDFSVISRRLGVDLLHLDRVRHFIPLAWEGDIHEELRASFSRRIAARAPGALAVFETTLRNQIDERFRVGACFCLLRTVIAPSLRSANLYLADYPETDETKTLAIESIPQLFDPEISLRKRIEINELVGKLHRLARPEASESDRYVSIAIIALSMNSLLGSFAESLRYILSENIGKTLADIDWDKNFPATGLPLIEKTATADAQLGGATVLAGQQLRLFLDAGGWQTDRPCFSELYFAVGPHKCPGMNYSRRAWKILSENLGTLKLSYDLGKIEYRKRDYVFNLLETMEIKIENE
jgi:cytochrome P450